MDKWPTLAQNKSAEKLMTKLANYYTNPRRGSGKGNPRSRYVVTMSVILAWAGVRKR